MPKLSLFRTLILVGVIIALAYWKRQRRRDQPVEERPSESESSDAVDEGLKTGIALVAQMRELARALRAVAGQIVGQLRHARQSIPPVLSDASTEAFSREA